MITGDYGLTAESVARRIGMLHTGSAAILTGAEVDALTDADLQRCWVKRSSSRAWRPITSCAWWRHSRRAAKSWP